MHCRGQCFEVPKYLVKHLLLSIIIDAPANNTGGTIIIHPCKLEEIGAYIGYYGAYLDTNSTTLAFIRHLRR